MQQLRASEMAQVYVELALNVSTRDRSAEITALPAISESWNTARMHSTLLGYAIPLLTVPRLSRTMLHTVHLLARLA